MVKEYHDKDIDDKVLKGKTVAVIGYGSQGRAQALNMKDSGVNVVVGLRPGKSWKQAEADGLKVMTIIEAAKTGDVVIMLVPDMAQPVVWKEEISLVMGKAFAPRDPLWGTLIDVRRGGGCLFLRYAFPSTMPQ